MISGTPFDQPSQVDVEDGEVLVDGPEGIAYGMTPDAAEETGRRLIRAAGEARSQRSGDARA